MEKDLFSFLRKEFTSIGSPQEALWVFKELQKIDSTLAFKKAEEILIRRKKNEPLAYILGHWDFRELTLEVGSGVLIPRPETEELVGHVLDYLRKNPKKTFQIADFGAGSGAIGLSLLKEAPENHQLHLVESSQEALPYLRKNLSAFPNNFKTRAKIFDQDWKIFSEGVDLIVSNPPYISDLEFESLEVGVKDFEPFQALVSPQDANQKYVEIFQKAEEVLRPGGAIFFEYGPAQEGLWNKLVPGRYEWKTLKDQGLKNRFLFAFDTSR
jgi:release factor glutamine methyltransferase